VRPAREREQRGVALVLVLVTVAIMTVFATDFIRSTQVRVLGTLNIRDELRAEYLARSTVNLSRLLLSVQGVVSREMRRFHMRPPPLWQFADYFVLSFNEPGALEMVGSVIGAPMEGAKGFGGLGGSIQVSIVDEESKINLNEAVMGPERQAMLGRMLTALFSPPVYDELFDRTEEGGDLMSRERTVAALIDWADRDETMFGSEGAESNSYEIGRTSVTVKNAPYDDIDELFMVKGIDDDFWAAFIDPEPEHPEARTLTVWGSGKINVNTADPLVLFAVLCTFSQNPARECAPENMDAVFNLIQYMMDVRSLLSVPFANPSRFLQNVGRGVEGIPGMSLDQAGVGKFLTVDSQVFSIYATAEVGKARKRIWTVVDTRGMAAMGGGTILYWKMD